MSDELNRTKRYIPPAEVKPEPKPTSPQVTFEVRVLVYEDGNIEIASPKNVYRLVMSKTLCQAAAIIQERVHGDLVMQMQRSANQALMQQVQNGKLN